MGAGASSFLGQDFLVNHFGVQAYVDAITTGRLPVARWLHLGALGGTAYDAFWQAYSGRVCPTELAAGSLHRARAIDQALAPLMAAGLVRRIGPGAPARYALTARGFDAYHDLERSVTYRLIEPLWGQMLEEHAAEGDPAGWAAPARRRGGVAWQAASRVFERPVA